MSSVEAAVGAKLAPLDALAQYKQKDTSKGELSPSV